MHYIVKKPQQISVAIYTIYQYVITLRHYATVTAGVAEIKIQESALSGTAFTLIIRVLQYGVGQRHTFY